MYQTLGQGVLKQALKGFNACVFAYGQTGAGKTFSMMGASFDVGIVPRMCEDLFAIIDKDQTELAQFEVEVSFFEIYNEQVFDLLKHTGKPMKVRNHKVLGPYVEGLAKLAVTSFARINELMEDGNKNKTVAATNMNATSSRGHSIFTVELKQTNYQKLDNGKLKSLGSKASKISLVDLAGSERQTKTGASGAKLKEGANINKSLTTLGMVIAALAEPEKAGKKAHIPYRDSALTFLLQQGLGGNSKTVMVAAISPAADNFDESMSTLRYADRAKQIVNKAVVNEDATARIIRELKEEIERMKAAGMGGGGGGPSAGPSSEEFEKMKAEMAENARLLAEFQMSKEEKAGVSDEMADEIRKEAAEAAAKKDAENAALKAEADKVAGEKAAMEAQLIEREAVQAEKDRQIEELMAKMKAMETNEFAAMEAQAAPSAEDAAAFAALGIPIPAAVPGTPAGGGGGGGAAATAAIKAQLDKLEAEKAAAAEAAAAQAAENAAVTLKHQIDSIVSDAKTTVTHRDDASENDNSMIMSLTYSITDLEDRILDGDEPDPEGATKTVVQDVSNMIVQADFMVEAAVIRIGDASRKTCKAIAMAAPAAGIVFNEVRQGQLDTYKQMVIKEIEDQGMTEIAKAKAKFAANSQKLEKARTRLMKHIGSNAASKQAFQAEEQARIAAQVEAALSEERARNDADMQAKIAEMEQMKADMAANAAAGGGGGGVISSMVTAKIQAEAKSKMKVAEAAVSDELAKVEKEKDDVAALEAMGIDQSAAKAKLADREAAAKRRRAAAEKAMADELAAAENTSSASMEAELAAQAEAEMKEMEDMRLAHQKKLDAIKRNKEKLTANFVAKQQAEIAEVAASNNPFLNPFATAVEVTEPEPEPDANPFGAPAGGSKAAANVDVKKKKEKFTRQLTMQKAKQKSNEVTNVVAWFGTKSAELHDAEQDYEDAKVLQEGRANKEKQSGLNAKVRMVLASSKKLHKDYSEKVAAVQAKSTGEVKHKHKLVKQLDDYEKEILVGIGKEATLLAACESEVNAMQSSNQRFKGEIRAMETKCRDDGMEAAEIDYIISRYKLTNSANEARYTDALEHVAAANDAMVKFTAPLKEMCTTLMAGLLFPEADSPAARQAAIKAGAEVKNEKVLKYKILIHQMANSEMGDTKHDKASILKYIEKATGKKEALLKKILGGIGKHSVHGLLFMSGPKMEKPWEARHVYFDLRDRQITIKTADNKKQLKQASLKTVRAVSFFPKAGHKRSDGKACDFAFCVMLQPPGKAAETWNFSAMNELEMLIWKLTFDAAPPPDHTYR